MSMRNPPESDVAGDLIDRVVAKQELGEPQRYVVALVESVGHPCREGRSPHGKRDIGKHLTQTAQPRACLR
jgi:hypothetical protein